MVTTDTPMFHRHLEHAGRTRRFVIATRRTGGWEVREEEGREVVKQSLYDDWHRVERARLAFDLRVSTLEEQGWTDVVEARRVRVGGR